MAIANEDTKNPLPPAHSLNRIARVLLGECERHPQHTVTLRQQEVERIFSLSYQAKVANEVAVRRLNPESWEEPPYSRTSPSGTVSAAAERQTLLHPRQ